MTLNLGGALGTAANTFGTYMKKFVLPLAIGIGVIGVICAAVPAASKILQ